MQTRREFMRNAAVLSGAIGAWGALAGPIRRALAIDPEPGTGVFDAEHVVILMQENRSFDHCFGTLRGVRGYNDPRAITLPNGNPVWVQTDSKGASHLPFRLDIRDTRATWMGSLPHTWPSQVDAGNHGRHDRWLDAKRSGHREYAGMPLTMGHYTRQDIPFYYALADAFTVCDQHFCSSLTPTLPNRLHLWTGTLREDADPNATANVRNDQIEQNKWTRWTTFPERLEDHGVSWKIYQNELSVDSGFTAEQDAWLSNFGDNVIEYFAQFHPRSSQAHRDWLASQVRDLPDEIEKLRTRLAAPGLSEKERAAGKKRLAALRQLQKRVVDELAVRPPPSLEQLSPRQRSLHEKAFSTNAGDPAYRRLTELVYSDGDVERTVQVLAGDVLHQFRADVESGRLPTVSWLVAPERLSDHPESAWYGAWYISETLNILTRNPEVWKKTVFILTYDENDGYFDHVPPFVAPRPNHPETGFASRGIDTTAEYVELEQDRSLGLSGPRESPVGLGYRVPMVVASPWSRGGCVCSQVFDHTSILQFLEKFLTHRTGRPIQETNISQWRRTICGDLASIFQPSHKGPDADLAFLPRDPFIEEIHRAKFKELPSGFRQLTSQEIEIVRNNPHALARMPRQEPGVRRSCPLPYELYVDGSVSADRERFTIRMESARNRFGDRSAGCPFTIYAMTGPGEVGIRNYAVAAGDALEDSWNLRDFVGGVCRLRVCGPNGFFREFVGSAADPLVDVRLAYVRDGSGALSGDVEVRTVNRDTRRPAAVEISHRSYEGRPLIESVAPGGSAISSVDAQASFHWYDLSVRLTGSEHFERRFAGRVETGRWGFTDPAMGRAV